MKKFLVFIFLVGVLVFTYFYRNNITFYIMKNFVDKGIAFGDANAYYKDVDYSFVQNTDNLFPKTRQDILNIIYTSLNRGVSEVSFYCDYDECISDVNEIADDSDLLASINNFVHPFNSYNRVFFTISDYGRVRIKVNRVYSDSSILLVENEIDRIMDSLFKSGMSDYDKIKAFHDYIINNTVYDSSVSLTSQMYVDTNSSNALGLLFEKKAICSGYSDTMAIFLNKMGFNNYKISSDTHIWNLVYYNDSWLHIDATWDDPVTNDGSNILLNDFLLISTDQLNKKEENLNKSEHIFDENVFLEAK